MTSTMTPSGVEQSKDSPEAASILLVTSTMTPSGVEQRVVVKFGTLPWDVTSTMTPSGVEQNQPSRAPIVMGSDLDDDAFGR